jgi:hypothetical protein
LLWHQREKLEKRIKSLEEKLSTSEERFLNEVHVIQRAKFNAGRETFIARRAVEDFIARGAVEEQKESKEPPEETSREVMEVDYNDTTDEGHDIQRAKFRAGREAFIARGAVEKQKESKEPPEETSRDVVEVDYDDDSTDEGQAEGEFFFPSNPSTPGTEGVGEATETAADLEPGLQPSSSTSTVWDGNQWKDPEGENPTPEGDRPTSEPDQEVTQEATREENPKGPEEEKELVGRGHRARRASRVPEASPMAKAQPKKARKQPAGKGKGRNSGAK